MYERRYAEAINVLENTIAGRDRPLGDSQRITYLSSLARLQQFSGDMVHARETWQQVKTDAEKLRATKGQNFALRQIVRQMRHWVIKRKRSPSLNTVGCCQPAIRSEQLFLLRLRQELPSKVATTIWRWSN